MIFVECILGGEAAVVPVQEAEVVVPSGDVAAAAGGAEFTEIAAGGTGSASRSEGLFVWAGEAFSLSLSLWE